MTQFNSLIEENRLYNWYHGYTKVDLPYFVRDVGKLLYSIETSATTGSIKTQYFGDKYDPDKIKRNINFIVTINPPANVKKNPKYTMTLEIEKVSMVLSGNSEEVMIVAGVPPDTNQNILVYNFTAPDENEIFIVLTRDVTQYDVNSNENLQSMPGFEMKWSYNHDIKPDPKYKDGKNLEFRRYKL